MTATEIQQLKALIVATALYYEQSLPDTVVEMYAEDLADLNFADVSVAIKAARRDRMNRKFPLPAVIRAVVQPSVDPRLAASDLARQICAAIGRKGYTWAWSGGYAPHATFRAAVEHELGELAWFVIERSGGWALMHEQYFSSDEGIFFAQLRDHVQAVDQLARADRLQEKPVVSRAIERHAQKFSEMNSAPEDPHKFIQNPLKLLSTEPS